MSSLPLKRWRFHERSTDEKLSGAEPEDPDEEETVLQDPRLATAEETILEVVDGIESKLLDEELPMWSVCITLVRACARAAVGSAWHFRKEEASDAIESTRLMELIIGEVGSALEDVLSQEGDDEEYDDEGPDADEVSPPGTVLQ